MLHVGTTIRPGENINFSFDEKGEAYINAKGGGGGVTVEELYAHSVATGFEGTYDDWLREYLARQTGLKWCSGEIGNRSLAANAITAPALINTIGDNAMIDDGAFVANESGVFALYVTEIYVTSNGRLWSFVYRNNIDANDKNRESGNLEASGSSIRPAVWVGHLDAGEKLIYAISSTVAQSSISLVRPGRFYFSQLTGEDV